MHLIQTVEKEMGKAQLPNVHVGDSVEVHYLIKEGEKERIQLFIGIVIGMRGRGIRRTMTVRRIVQGEGVERVFPLHSPRVKDVVTTRSGETRRSKLYFLRERVGKRTRLKEVFGVKGEDETAQDAAAPAAPAPGKSKGEKVSV